ncbi:CDP-glycerol glycerophosphotransferase family protein [Microbacterium sp. ET2]|uniref:CDP-glycerol glycerophosphotransferase family protein n=1 Tax=Microbacterium albipurpureum TaxID=3050384 RepID=UPI00259CA585|nr:CDP-glycerol glycerophosphotransferase family protein [Microbacterium sp. ET2 (Ac-2212)]WJL95910.1 CDP-glycerol glycerophosphotransferase family protein [Microbacterium sp. ET2 (Ac-2212)]
MASFSFGAGNARKVASIPLYALGRVVTLFAPRRPDVWVFGCAVGIADGALALWEEAAAHGRRSVWLTASEDEDRDAAARGIPTVRKSTLRGFWLTARAGVLVVTHGFGDVNRYATGGAFVVQLWHGIPLKRIGLDSPETLRSSILPRSRAMRALIRAMYRGATRRIGLIPAASHLVRGRLESAFSLTDERVAVTGEPRVDVLSQGSAEERRRRARDLLSRTVGSIEDAARVVLYAPTWRDGAPDPAVPTAADWSALGNVLEAENAILLVRSHPLGAGEYVPPVPSGRIRMLGSDLLRDVTPALPGIDLLITDYSSLVFDAGLNRTPVLFLAPDIEQYAARRGFYGSFEEGAGGDLASDWTEIIRRLGAAITDGPERARMSDRSAARSADVHAFRDGGNTARVYRAILNATGAATADGRTRGRR